MSNDSVGKTFLVAALICIVCSVLVSAAAVGLKPVQEFNKALETKRNILQAAGLMQPGITVEEAFREIETRVVDLQTGEIKSGPQYERYDQTAASKDPALSIRIPKERDLGKIKRRAKLANVYLVAGQNGIETIVLPIYGKGLWSTMRAFLALGGDANTVKGYTFYEHGETPGLGGEVDNPSWQGQWVGKRIFDENWNLSVDILKGRVDPSRPEAVHQVDGLSGATLTTVGIENFMLYWLGEDGFGPFLARLRAKGGSNG